MHFGMRRKTTTPPEGNMAEMQNLFMEVFEASALIMPHFAEMSKCCFPPLHITKQYCILLLMQSVVCKSKSKGEIMSDQLATIEVSELATIDAPAHQQPAAVYLASLGKRSKRVMADNLERVAAIATGGQCNAATMPWQAVNAGMVTAIQAKLKETYSANKTNQMMYALRGVLKAAWRIGLMPEVEYRRAIDFKPVKSETLPAGRAIKSGELKALFDGCDATTPKGARDAALLALLYGGGLRRSEAVAIDLADYDAATGELKVLHAKGGKQRNIYASNGSKEALDAWLAIRGDDAGAMFTGITKGGNMTARRISDQAILFILKERAAAAGIDDISPHDFRRTFASDLLDAGVDIVTVQKLMGHASVTTTARYDRRGEAAKKKAADMLHVPFAGK